MIESFDVSAPENIDEQRAIAHILGTLDDKIEVDRRLTEALEAIAQALFKSWLAGTGCERTEVSDLIRDEVLEIGDGYRAKNSELGRSGLPFIRAGNLSDGFDTSGAELLCEKSVAKAGRKVCRIGDVAFTSKGTIGRFARVTEHTAKFVYSPQVCYWRSLDHTRLHPFVLYCWMQSADLLEQIAAVAGQTDMAPYVSLQDQRRMTMPAFPRSQDSIARTIEPLFARQSLSSAETRTLADLRDALLPKLISGELRVRDADSFISRAIA
jgi:type I restriction enzyme S subunit